jgi:CHAD domain-containing protein
MPAAPAASAQVMSPPEALARFLKRVWEERKEAGEELAPDAVHDLRVALRRCRSLAEGFAELEGHRQWRQFRRAARRLQGGLTELRDAQVMAGWIRRLRLTGDPAGDAMAESLRRDERKACRAARRALADFPRKRWRRWRSSLPERAERFAATPAALADLALRRAREAGELERRWRRSDSQAAAHRLRIAVKRFRYTVEGFLPAQYAPWGRDLKRMQDCLGEMHDLDVLRGRVLQLTKKGLLSPASSRAWLRKIQDVREERAQRYRRIVSPKARTARRGRRVPMVWERWIGELYSMAWINPPKTATPSESEASAAPLPEEKTPPPPGRPRPLSSAS